MKQARGLPAFLQPFRLHKPRKMEARSGPLILRKKLSRPRLSQCLFGRIGGAVARFLSAPPASNIAGEKCGPPPSGVALGDPFRTRAVLPLAAGSQPPEGGGPQLEPSGNWGADKKRAKGLGLEAAHGRKALPVTVKKGRSDTLTVSLSF